MAQYQDSLQLIFRSTVVACGQKSQKTANLKPKHLYNGKSVFAYVQQSAEMKRCYRNSQPSTTISTNIKTVL